MQIMHYPQNAQLLKKIFYLYVVIFGNLHSKSIITYIQDHLQLFDVQYRMIFVFYVQKFVLNIYLQF